MLGDVLRGHHATGRLDGPRDLGADRSAVVGIAPALGDLAQRGRQQRLPERVAGVARGAEHVASGVVEAGQ